MGARSAPPGARRRPQVPRAGHPLRRLLGRWQSRARPGHDHRQHDGAHRPQAQAAGAVLVRWRYNRYMHDYLGCVKAVDESVGKLLKFLDDEGLAENTLVIYTADQGFYLGEHGWFDKRWIFEESVRTPLLVRWPSVVQPETTCA